MAKKKIISLSEVHICDIQCLHKYPVKFQGSWLKLGGVDFKTRTVS